MTVGRLACAVGLTVLLCSCAHGGGASTGVGSRASAPAGSPSAPAGSSSAAGLLLVALGDSDAGVDGDPTGKGWVGVYADLIQRRTGQRVSVRSHATSDSTAADLAARLSSDPALQADVTAADFVVLGIGGGDLNRADTASLDGVCAPQQCYDTAVTEVGRALETVAARITELRSGDPVVLRAITLPNILPGAEDVIPPDLVRIQKPIIKTVTAKLRDHTCTAVRAHGGDCIDVLTRFNGATGTQDAYAAGLLNHDACCYPSTQGHQVIAQMLVDSGTDPRPLR